ncbi:hypothetical protein GEMRC1_011213 [Eukaryota sp. GEM-RC1]
MEDRWRCLCFSLQREISILLSSSTNSFSDVLKILDWRSNNTLTETEFIDLLHSQIISEQDIQTPSTHASHLTVRDLADKLATKSETELHEMLCSLHLYHNALLSSQYSASLEWLSSVQELFVFLDSSNVSYLTVHDVVFLSILTYFQMLPSTFDPDDLISITSLIKRQLPQSLFLEVKAVSSPTPNSNTHFSPTTSLLKTSPLSSLTSTQCALLLDVGQTFLDCGVLLSMIPFPPRKKTWEWL